MIGHPCAGSQLLSSCNTPSKITFRQNMQFLNKCNSNSFQRKELARRDVVISRRYTQHLQLRLSAIFNVSENKEALEAANTVQALEPCERW